MAGNRGGRGGEAKAPGDAARPNGQPQPVVVGRSPDARSPQDVEGNYSMVTTPMSTGFWRSFGPARPPRPRVANTRRRQASGCRAWVVGRQGRRESEHRERRVRFPCNTSLPLRRGVPHNTHPAVRPGIRVTPPINVRVRPCGLEGGQPCEFRRDSPSVHPQPGGWSRGTVRPVPGVGDRLMGRAERRPRLLRRSRSRGWRSARRCPTGGRSTRHRRPGWR